jgi:hypothetical protein
MTAILKVDTIQDTAGNNIINENANTVTIGKAGDTVNVVGTLQNGGTNFAQGITEADQWRLTANTNTNTDADVTANWERVDTTLWDKLGTGMTESSGIFTFPSSGYWLVINAPTITADFNDPFASLDTYFSSDSGSSYTRFSRVSSGNLASSGNTTIAPSKPDIIKVTNSSNFRMKFQTSSFGGTNTSLRGDTNYNFTLITFIKLGDI